MNDDDDNEKQNKLLDKEDGRFFAIDKFGTGLATIATTERLKGRVVSFGLPSGPALFLDLAYNAFQQTKNYDPFQLFQDHPGQGRWPDDQRCLFDYLENVILHVTFSFTAVEAFSNEAIPEGYRYTHKKKSGEIILDKLEIERNLSLDEKLHLVLPTARAVPTPKGKRCWENYKKLKNIRDRLIHLKSSDHTASGPETETIWGILLREYDTPFCDHAHAIIGHFKPLVADRRWYKKYPYRT